jgi:hypothetical protein
MCNSTLVCSKCVAYYGLMTTGAVPKCEKCTIPYCRACDGNKTRCLQCDSGYRLTNYTDSTQYCESCDAGCASCNTTRKTCDTCITSGNYYLENGVCRTAVDGCVDWNLNSGSCNLCKYGFMLREGKCYPCFGEQSGYIDCPTAQTYSQFGTLGTNVRRLDTPVASRILALLDDVEVSF